VKPSVNDTCACPKLGQHKDKMHQTKPEHTKGPKFHQSGHTAHGADVPPTAHEEQLSHKPSQGCVSQLEEKDNRDK
jgi:hypothetical protein